MVNGKRSEHDFDFGAEGNLSVNNTTAWGRRIAEVLLVAIVAAAGPHSHAQAQDQADAAAKLAKLKTEAAPAASHSDKVPASADTSNQRVPPEQSVVPAAVEKELQEMKARIEQLENQLKNRGAS